MRAEFVAIAHEEGAVRHPGVEQALQQVRGDERLARAGREREQRTILAVGDLLEDSADRGILVVETE